jgi:hypothetical protein
MAGFYPLPGCLPSLVAFPPWWPSLPGCLPSLVAFPPWWPSLPGCLPFSCLSASCSFLDSICAALDDSGRMLTPLHLFPILRLQNGRQYAQYHPSPNLLVLWTDDVPPTLPFSHVLKSWLYPRDHYDDGDPKEAHFEALLLPRQQQNFPSSLRFWKYMHDYSHSTAWYTAHLQQNRSRHWLYRIRIARIMKSRNQKRVLLQSALRRLLQGNIERFQNDCTRVSSIGLALGDSSSAVLIHLTS